MRPPWLLPLAVLATFATARAQVATQATLVGGAVRAGTTLASLPTGNTLVNDLLRSCAGPGGSAHLACGFVESATTIDLQWSLGCTATGTGTAVAEATVRYDFVAATPFTGRLVVTWIPTAAGTGSTLLEVDLGADGTIDANGTAVLPVTFAAGTTSLRLHVLCQAAAGAIQGPFGSSYGYHGNAHGSLGVRLEPDHCSTQAVGAPCGIAQFGAAGTFARDVVLAAEVPQQADLALLALGFTAIAVPLPLPPGCLLHVDPVILDGRLVAPDGAVAWLLAPGATAPPLSFRAQLLGLDLNTLAVTGSQPLLVDWH